MPAIYCKKFCFVQSELDQFNMQKICKTINKIKAIVDINLGSNATAIQWPCSKPNNDNIQYNMTVQLPVANIHLDQYPWTLASFKESAINVENLDIESGIVELT